MKVAIIDSSDPKDFYTALTPIGITDGYEFSQHETLRTIETNQANSPPPYSRHSPRQSPGDHPEALVGVFGYLIDEVDLPSEVLAHRFLAAHAALPRRENDVDRLAGPVARPCRPAFAHASVSSSN